MYARELRTPFKKPYSDQQWIDALVIPQAGKNYMLADLDSTINTNPELLSWLNSFGLEIPFWDVFVSAPDFSMHIHNDNNDGIDDMTKLNWVYEDGYSEMIWYKPKEHSTPTIYKNAGMEDYALSWRHDDVEPVFSAVIGNPSLVNAGHPHNIVNVSSKKRVCLSFFLIDKETGKPLQWQKAMELFKDCIL